MGVNQNELSPEESQLMAKHALLAERQKELEDLRQRYREMQEQQKKAQKSIAAETPGQATEIAKKLAASGQLITNKSSGSRTTGFKRTAKAMKAPVSEEKLFNELDDEAFSMKETPRVSKNEDEIDISQESAEAIGSLLRKDEEDMSEDSKLTAEPSGESASPVPKKNPNFHKRPRMEFVKSKDGPQVSDVTTGEKAFGGAKPKPTGSKDFKESYKIEQKPKMGEATEATKGNTIFIRNTGLSEAVVKKICSPFGEIHNLHFDKGRKPFVTYTTIEAAETAISKLNRLEITEEFLGEDVITMANLTDTTLHVFFAKQQRYMHIAQDLKHDWSKISAAVKPLKTSEKDRDRASKRSLTVYDDDPF